MPTRSVKELLSKLVQRFHIGQIDQFDATIGLSVFGLALAILGTILIGDRAGVGVIRHQPDGDVHTTTPVRILFSEAMDPVTVERAFQVDPPLDGTFTWNGFQVTFSPRVASAANQTYRIRLKEGALSLTGRQLLAPEEWQFKVNAPQVLYLAPAIRETDTSITNLYLVDPTQPEHPVQLTFSRFGVVNFAPSPDGTQIAYAETTIDGTVDLWLLTAKGLESRRLTRCIAAICQSPAWSPDGSRIAYERIEQNKEIQAIDQGAARTWILNVRDLSAAPLFSDSQSLGGTPKWSADGTQIAFYDRNLGAIVVYTIATEERQLIKTVEGIAGDYAFSPNGNNFVYPQLVNIQNSFYTELSLADFDKRTLDPLTDDQTPVSDYSPAWSPADGKLALSRRYLDGRSGTSPQVYLFDPNSRKISSLINDPNYYHGALQFDPTGSRLVMMRRSEIEAAPTPEIWVFDLPTKSLWKVATNGFLPQWLP